MRLLGRTADQTLFVIVGARPLSVHFYTILPDTLIWSLDTYRVSVRGHRPHTVTRISSSFYGSAMVGSGMVPAQ